MDAQPEFNPPYLLESPDKSPMFSCFLDCCKPKKEMIEEKDVPRTTNQRVAEVVKSKEDLADPVTTDRALVAPDKNAFSPQVFMEFLKMLLSFLLIESLGKKASSAKVVNDIDDAKQEQEDIPIIEG